MARPLRLEFPGALYHVTSLGDRSEDIYRWDEDRRKWLRILEEVCGRFNWTVHAFCQMGNHYHLVVETIDGNLSRGMRQLNGRYTQWFNRRHEMVGHLFQGRYKAILVQRESHLLELARYVVLNPVRAGMVNSAEQWRWSSYAMMISAAPTPDWLHTDWLLSQFSDVRAHAVEAYRQFVRAGHGSTSPHALIRHELLLGDDAFLRRCGSEQVNIDATETPKIQKRGSTPTLDEYKARFATRQEAMARAYLSGAYTMAQVARHFQLHYQTVSRAVKAFEQGKEMPAPGPIA